MENEGAERREIVGQMGELHEAIAQLTTDVSWLVRLGKWALTVMGGGFMLLLSLGIPLLTSMHAAQETYNRRLESIEQSVGLLNVNRQHVTDRAREDHRSCHSEVKK